MICFANDSLAKIFQNIRQFSELDERLRNKVIPRLAEILAEMGANLVMTSVWRGGPGDHADYRAVDVRVWSLSEKQRKEVEEQINEEFKGDGITPTCKYWHPGNSKGKYSPHFHVRVSRHARSPSVRR